MLIYLIVMLFIQKHAPISTSQMAQNNPKYVITTRAITEEERTYGWGGKPQFSGGGGNGGGPPSNCTKVWWAVDPTHPEQGGPGGCY